jgi:integrase
MAFWGRTKTGAVRIYKTVDGKQVALSRVSYKHLDAQPDHIVDHYVKSLEPPKHQPLPEINYKMSSLISQFLDYLRSRKLNPSTIEMRRMSLVRDVVPFFIQQKLLNPIDWPVKSVKLLEHFKAQGLSNNTILHNNTALHQFWKWLKEENLVPSSLPTLNLRRPVIIHNSTPLKFSLTPDMVLAYARSAKPELAFVALAGYFFSLRTQEVLALTRTDFRAGSACLELQCAKVMLNHKLYSRFCVNISKQNSRSLKDPKAPPKVNSRGWVACFSEEAAKMLVGLIKALAVESGDSKPLVPFGVDWNVKVWRRGGIPGITLKDLRRASIYWLGHYTTLGIVEIKNHARHSQIKTTELYLRRPEEDGAQFDDLDLDA